MIQSSAYSWKISIEINVHTKSSKHFYKYMDRKARKMNIKLQKERIESIIPLKKKVKNIIKKTY